LEAGVDPEGEADEVLQEVQQQKAPFKMGLAERGAGAHYECSVQETQRKSALLGRLDEVLCKGEAEGKHASCRL
jgi:hypothetical protein